MTNINFCFRKQDTIIIQCQYLFNKTHSKLTNLFHNEFINWKTIDKKHEHGVGFMIILSVTSFNNNN